MSEITEGQMVSGTWLSENVVPESRVVLARFRTTTGALSEDPSIPAIDFADVDAALVVGGVTIACGVLVNRSGEWCLEITHRAEEENEHGY
ncbi:MAG: hypothetical protein PF508_15500 [Spirochaeta sp.]|nr:hypothetical protein [Spirochaeta sp.]